MTLGSPELLGTYPGGIGGNSYAGWGYPSVVRALLSDGTAGFRMLYSGTSCNQTDCFYKETMYAFLAESVDGVEWEPVISPHAPPGAPPGALFVSEEVGAVYDDGDCSPPAERYKMLLPSTRILVSADAETWTPFSAHWTATSVDPGFHVLRTGLSCAAPLVVTARPQALRAAGRHAGVITASSWAGLGALNATATEPLDGEIYTPEDQVYGFPAFNYAAVLAAGNTSDPVFAADVGGNYVAHLWRLLAANGETGFVTSGLAYSADAMSWEPVPGAPAQAPTIADGAAMGSYPYASPPAASGPACAAACAADAASCAAWSFTAAASPSSRGSGAGTSVASTCALQRDVSAPTPTSSADSTGLCPGLTGPLPVVPPLLRPPADPTAANYRQSYPKSLVLSGNRLLFHSAASQTLHGQSAPNMSATQVWGLRVDGFVAMTTPTADTASTAAALTVGLVWTGGDMLVNADCTAGGGASVRVSVLDPATGLPVQGFAPADAVPLQGPSGDELRWVPTWTSGRTLAELAGDALAFRIDLTGGARVYALRGALRAAA